MSVSLFYLARRRSSAALRIFPDRMPDNGLQPVRRSSARIAQIDLVMAALFVYVERKTVLFYKFLKFFYGFILVVVGTYMHRLTAQPLFERYQFGGREVEFGLLFGKRFFCGVEYALTRYLRVIPAVLSATSTRACFYPLFPVRRSPRLRRSKAPRAAERRIRSTRPEPLRRACSSLSHTKVHRGSLSSVRIHPSRARPYVRGYKRQFGDLDQRGSGFGKIQLFVRLFVIKL